MEIRKTRWIGMWECKHIYRDGGKKDEGKWGKKKEKKTRVKNVLVEKQGFINTVNIEHSFCLQIWKKKVLFACFLMQLVSHLLFLLFTCNYVKYLKPTLLMFTFVPHCLYYFCIWTGIIENEIFNYFPLMK